MKKTGLCYHGIGRISRSRTVLHFPLFHHFSDFVFCVRGKKLQESSKFCLEHCCEVLVIVALAIQKVLVANWAVNSLNIFDKSKWQIEPVI